MVGEIPVLTHLDRRPQDHRGSARRSLVYCEIRQSADGSESPRKPVVTPNWAAAMTIPAVTILRTGRHLASGFGQGIAVSPARKTRRPLCTLRYSAK